MPTIKRALLSVTDKSNIVSFARSLNEEFGVEIISTGGTAKLLRESHVSVRDVSEVTGSPDLKSNIVSFARSLNEEFGVEIISTGGTAKLLRESHVSVRDVSEVTGF